MVDEKVLKAQKWLNSKYRGVVGFDVVPEDGRTGWPTIFGLIRGLQNELGISPLVDSFGANTTRLLNDYLNQHGNIDKDTPNKNLIYIIQCAMYCKGYEAGDIDGQFSLQTQSGIINLKADMGIPGSSKLDLKTFKSLLSMNAFVLVPGGRSAIREVQQWLNSNFSSRRDFDISPCDGYFSRGVQQALMLGIQFSLGMGDGVATGNLGPGTRNGIKSQGVLQVGTTDSTSHMVQLFKAAMIFNGYESGIDFGNRTYTSTNASAVSDFQDFALLPKTGQGDYQTWCSLLVSTGDPDRLGKAADCMTPLTESLRCVRRVSQTMSLSAAAVLW